MESSSCLSLRQLLLYDMPTEIRKELLIKSELSLKEKKPHTTNLVQHNKTLDHTV